MGMMEAVIEIPAEHAKNLFGQFDVFAKKIERALHVTLIARDESVKILGDAAQVERARSVLSQLLELSRRGNVIQEQNVDYTLALAMEGQEDSVLEIDRDIICHTLQGKPIKPKTVGQKKYVDAIRRQMIVFGLGQKLWDRIPLILGLAVCAVLFLITMPVSDGYLGLPGTLAWKIPAGWYEFGWLFPLGIHRADFFSADYFPLFPWIFLFFCGTYIGRWARNGKFPDFTYRLRFTSLSWMGRHALILYLIHQPLIFGVCTLISWIISL